ncbi:thrombospondin type 3 repeat-containing protein [Nannocystis sp.]|uniref:thrombospondin type 3 repeat-containing protein n=1 Tax=Nannocystis sp. TaxID=1962667 RepID=UPI0025F1E08F|nr:thrombospondin type 3 repeat-containing protein [Nannocystis sp.]MBK7826397.1 thrombospondin type 3 repeat-containing protein [Nannocystis sp.]
MTSTRPIFAVHSRGLSLAAPLLALGLALTPGDAAAVCSNGDLLDCNPVGQTLNPAARFVDPNPPPGYTQCAGFINTNQDDVNRFWENNCLPFKGGQLWLRLYDLNNNIIAGAHLFDGVGGCPWGASHIGYDTDMNEGAGFLDQQGACNDGAGVSLAWFIDNSNYCGCGDYSCNDIYTANQANNKVLYVGGDASNPGREIVYSGPGGKGGCAVDGNAVFFAKLAIYNLNPDADGDGVPNPQDNCPNDANANQADADNDDLGDVCDACPDDPDNDVDKDLVCGDVDLCPDDPDPDQEDADSDALGDACDACPADPDNDVDLDLVCGDVDLCPQDADPNQEDADSDTLGDVCDACPNDPDNDADADAVCGDLDNCPIDANPGQEDGDMNGMGDACDPIDPPGTTSGSTTDTTDGTTSTTTDATSTTGDAESTGNPTTTDPGTTGTPTSDPTGTPTSDATTLPQGDSTGEPAGSSGSGSDSDTAGVDDGGCGCTSAGTPPMSALWLGLAGLALRRRRRGA